VVEHLTRTITWRCPFVLRRAEFRSLEAAANRQFAAGASARCLPPALNFAPFLCEASVITRLGCSIVVALLIAAPAAAECVNINTASLEELQRIIHIGPDRATEIIQLRPFSSVDSLERVTGIGPSRLSDIKREGIAAVSCPSSTPANTAVTTDTVAESKSGTGPEPRTHAYAYAATWSDFDGRPRDAQHRVAGGHRRQSPRAAVLR
jgi:competence ComEA-like helix-hairpin-helix protein